MPTRTEDVARCTLLALYASAVVGCYPGSTVEPFDPRIVCDRFELRWELDGDALLLAIDTDLPDETQLLVSVGRSYYYVGSDVRDHHDYLDVREPLSLWREPRRISLDPDAWRAAVAARQTRMGPVAEISPDVRIRAFLPSRQDFWRFGQGNRNLSGTATSRIATGVIVETETHFEFPLE